MIVTETTQIVQFQPLQGRNQYYQSQANFDIKFLLKVFNQELQLTVLFHFLETTQRLRVPDQDINPHTKKIKPNI